MSEFNAAVGLLQLQDLEAILLRRAEIDASYRELLAGVRGISCLRPVRQKKRNCAYFPIFVGREYGMPRDALYEHLKEHGVFGHWYFYPLISDFPMYNDLPSATRANLPVAAPSQSRSFVYLFTLTLRSMMWLVLARSSGKWRKVAGVRAVWCCAF